MEVLLLEDIAGVGKRDDILIVGDGFALNYLLPQRKALVATPTVRRRYAEQIKRRAEEKEREKQLQSQASQALAGKSVTISRKVAKAGKLYGGVTERDIAGAIENQLGLKIRESNVSLSEPIKSTGTFQVLLVFGGQKVQLPIIVTAEEKQEKKAACSR